MFVLEHLLPFIFLMVRNLNGRVYLSAILGQQQQDDDEEEGVFALLYVNDLQSYI